MLSEESHGRDRDEEAEEENSTFEDGCLLYSGNIAGVIGTAVLKSVCFIFYITKR